MAVADFSRINSNIGALNALNSLNNVNKNLGMYQSRLATGRRINSAADDPAGLTIATKFRTRNEGLKVAQNNIGDSQNLLSVAEGGAIKIQDILIEMRNKAEAAASDTLGDDERAAIKQQLNDLTAEIDNIVNTTKWNNQLLLDGGGFASKITFQTGADVNDDDRLELELTQSLKSNSLSIGATSSVAADVTAPGDLLYSGLGGSVNGDEISTTSAGNALFPGLSELGTGSYRMDVSRDAANEVTVRLYDLAADKYVTIDADNNNATDPTGTVATFDVTAGGGLFDFGNGLQVTFSNADIAASESFSVQLEYTRAGSGTVFSEDVDTAQNARDSIVAIDGALKKVSGVLQTVGSTSARLSYKEETLASAQINTEAAYNRIMNADMAMSQLEATKFQILQQTATSMLAQANQAPQGLLSLFR